MNKNKIKEIEISSKNDEDDILIDNSNGNINYNSEKEYLNDSLILEKKKEIKSNNNLINRYCKLPFIFHFFILFVLFSIIITIIYILFYYTSNPNFRIIHYNWDASYVNDRKYENYIFDNGLEVMLIQDQSFDRDGGAIVIADGYMNNPYDQGIARLATCLLNKIGTNDDIKNILDDYYGQYEYGTDEYFTNFRFEILNNGFKKYMYYFSLILNPQNISGLYEKYFEEIKKELDNIYNNNIYDNDFKEKHLIEYFVFGLKDDGGEEILPEGNNETISKYENDDKKKLKEKVTNYINKMIDPSKIIIVLFSKYKFLISAKYMKKYFQYLTHMEKPKNNEDNENKFDNLEFNTSQIFYIKIDYYEINYIKILYYIDKVDNESYIELFYKTKYLYYIIDFLEEKKEGSLYYLLTNSSDHNIKSITSSFQIVLKSKIEFEIYIELNCLKNINNIIYLTYQYMDTIIKKAIGNNLQMERYKELKNKFYQDVKYNDKTLNTIELAKSNAEKYYNGKYDLKYMLYVKYIPWYDNEQQIKDESYLYFKQLKPENSIVIIGLRDKDINKTTCNASCPFHLDCDYFIYGKNNETKYYNVHYKYDTFKFNSSDLEINNKINITYIENIYMTKYNKSFVGPEEYFPNITLKSQNIFKKFIFQRDVNFSLPKVYITLNLFHPYLRPMNSNLNIRKCYYFKINELFTAIKRKINEYLADAIRAGNEITIEQDENYLSINVFCYEDVAYKIMEKIKYVLFDINWESTDFISNNDIYKTEVFDDIFLYNKLHVNYMFRYYFYCRLKNNLFNKYEFYPEKFENEYYDECIENLDDELKNLSYFIINGFIYGYYNEEKGQDISDLFETNYDLNTFKRLSNYTNNMEVIDLKPEEILYWIKEIKELNENKTIDIPVDVYDKTDTYDCANYGMSYIKFTSPDLSDLNLTLFSSILEKVDYGEQILSINLLIYKDIYFEFLLFDENLDEIIPNITRLEKAWNNTLNNTFEYNNGVDNIGNRYYYVKKNFASTLIKEQTSLKQKAIEVSKGYFYEKTVLNYTQLYIDYTDNYKDKKFNKEELNNIINSSYHLTQRSKINIRTLKKNNFSKWNIKYDN